MKRRTTLISFLALGLTATAARAQEPQPAPPAPAPAMQMQSATQRTGAVHRRLHTLLMGIDLTAEQRTRVDSLTARYASQLPATPPESTADTAMQSRWRMLVPRLESDVRAALTSEQQRTWDRNVADLRARERRGVGD